MLMTGCWNTDRYKPYLKVLTNYLSFEYKSVQASLYNRVRLTRAGYANDWIQLFSACLVFTTYGVLWEGHSFHGWAQFYFVSLELLQRSVNILQTTAFKWDYASVLLSPFDPHYLKYCSLVGELSRNLHDFIINIVAFNN